MNKDLIEAIGKAGTGVICACGLVYAVVVLAPRITQVLERQTAALEVIAETYSGKGVGG